MSAPGFVDLLRTLTAIPGLSGHEDAVARALVERLRPHADDVAVDALGNVIARFGPETAGTRVAVLAHMDTVGLMVKQRHADGTLGVIAVGGANLKALPGTAVMIGDQPGIVGVRSQHLSRPGDGDTASAEALYVEGAARHVAVTTPVTYAPASVEMADGLYASPYLDDRAGCAVLLVLARRLRLAADTAVYLIGTVQEETTCAGAALALARVAPHAAFFVDGTLSYDTPDTRGRGMTSLGAGPALLRFLYISGLNGWHAHPALFAHAQDVAAEAHVRVQLDAVHGLMSDARATLPLGIPSLVVGLPMRGKHGPLETVSLIDLRAAADLLAALVSRPLPDLTRG